MSLVSDFSLNWNRQFQCEFRLTFWCPVTSTSRQGRCIFLLSGLRPSLMLWKLSAQKGKPEVDGTKIFQLHVQGARAGCNFGRPLSPEGTREIEPTGPRWWPVEHTPVSVFSPPVVTAQAASQPLPVRSCQVSHLLPTFQDFQVNQDRKTKPKKQQEYTPSDFEWVRESNEPTKHL